MAKEKRVWWIRENMGIKQRNVSIYYRIVKWFDRETQIFR